MNILLTNDDGIGAPGLRYMAEALHDAGHNVLIVAPKEEQSGRSRAITLHEQMSLRPVELIGLPDVEAWSLSGTPGDCTRIGVLHLAKNPIDVIFSGINRGLNIGADVPYSGTISAALEGLNFNLSGIAVSGAMAYGKVYYKTAAQYAVELFEQVKDELLAEPLVLNVNVPPRNYEDILGYQLVSNLDTPITDQYRVTVREGHTQYVEVFNRYPEEAPEGGDLEKVRQGYVTVNPLTEGHHHNTLLEELGHWPFFAKENK